MSMTAFSAIFDVDTTKYKGYYQAQDPSGKWINYWYRFWGGDHHCHGVITVSKRGDGDSTFVIRFDELNTASRYQIVGVKLYSDPGKTKTLLAGPGDQFDSAIASEKR